MSNYALYQADGLAYPEAAPLYRPTTSFPEYPFGRSRAAAGGNAVYAGVRELFRLAGLDSDNFGTGGWNPLGAYVKPGDRVLVKPNLVMHENPTGLGTDCLYTHPSVIAAVVDYVIIALGGRGSIVLADAPMQSCDWDALVRESGLESLVSWYRAQGVRIELKDLRGLRSVETGHGLDQEVVDGASGRVVDLADASSFHGLPQDRIDSLRITNYDPDELRKHHTATRHEYYVSSELLDADVVVNLPKAKTHRKAGITGALKNMVGVNVRKEYLPHHSNGSKAEGFDEYRDRSLLKAANDYCLDARNRRLSAPESVGRDVFGFLARCFGFAGRRLGGDAYSEGSWYGNDTIWRTVADLNKIVFHADSDGIMHEELQRRMVVVCDMVTIGQGEGPLMPEPGDWHMLSFSDDPTTSDAAMARLMGTDERLIPVIHNALDYSGPFTWGNAEAGGVRCSSNDPRYDGTLVSALDSGLRARPTSGWAGHFEREE